MIAVVAALAIFALTLWLNHLVWARVERRRNLTRGQYGLTRTEEQVWKDLVNRYRKS
jgi:hypothetical protein